MVGFFMVLRRSRQFCFCFKSLLTTLCFVFNRFEKLVTYQRDNGEYRIDFARFHNTFTVETPCCSARELDEMIVSLNR